MKCETQANMKLVKRPTNNYLGSQENAAMKSVRKQMQSKWMVKLNGKHIKGFPLLLPNREPSECALQKNKEKLCAASHAVITLVPARLALYPENPCEPCVPHGARFSPVKEYAAEKRHWIPLHSPNQGLLQVSERKNCLRFPPSNHVGPQNERRPQGRQTDHCPLITDNCPSLLPAQHLYHAFVIIHGRVLNYNLPLTLSIPYPHSHPEHSLQVHLR